MHNGVARMRPEHNGVEIDGLLTNGRDRDLNDGLADPGADMWTSDVFHTRDMVRQSVVEYMQFVRMLRSMDGENLDFHGNVLGDVDLDGQIDIGGPENTIGMWGISLGVSSLASSLGQNRVLMLFHQMQVVLSA